MTRDGLDLLKPSLPGLEAALDDPDVSEIMINGPGNVWLEGHGRLRPIDAPALDAAALTRVSSTSTEPRRRLPGAALNTTLPRTCVLRRSCGLGTVRVPSSVSMSPLLPYTAGRSAFHNV